MTIEFYDIVAKAGTGAPFFSPSTSRVRLALLLKGIPFVTKEVTFSDLRFKWSGLDGPLGVAKATAPFLKLEDGSFIMDGPKIALWLDKTYPNTNSLFLPEAPLPVDVASKEYLQAVDDFVQLRKSEHCNVLADLASGND
ncbi:hypothetical protein T439DRAFT_61999 [Meredithblackwellia eburnea MCA 4105]